MTLQERRSNPDRASKELHPHGTPHFPCAGYSSHFTDRQEEIIPWHWHEELEIIYVERGQMKAKIPSETFLLKQGDCLAINADILHSAAAAPECRWRSLVFKPTLITGTEDSVFAQKYTLPLLSCRSFSGYRIDGEIHKDAAQWFNCAFEALAGNCWGFEFTVRENLSHICLFLYKQFEPLTDAQNPPLSQDNLRIRKMLAYIHRHFSENLSLADIAKAADISERECLRCFRKTIQLSPIQYLLKYRVMQGADMLLKDPSGSISEIAARCGFDSQSNFAKMFRRFYNCTPREYRRKKS